MKFKSIVLASLMASQFLSATSAEEVTFQATDFFHAYGTDTSPYETIDGEFDYDVDDTGAFILNSAEIRMGDIVITSAEIDAAQQFSTSVLIGGVSSGVGGITHGTNDFWVFFDYGSNELSNFAYSTEGADFFLAQTIVLNPTFRSVELTLDSGEGFFVPMAGGFVNYDVALSGYDNNLSLRQWSILTMPNGDSFPIHRLRTLAPIEPDGSLFIDDATFAVPSWFENGEYVLTWYVFDIATQTREIGTMSFNKGPILPSPTPTPSPIPSPTPPVDFSLDVPTYSEAVVDRDGNLEVIAK